VVGLAVVLGLLVGAVAGILAYHYAASTPKSRPSAPAQVSAAATSEKPEVSEKPAVRKVEPQLIDGAMQVTITLDQPVRYDAHRLDHPDRVYIDLHDVRLASDLAGKTVFVNNGGLADIRLAATQPDTVRLVLDLEKRFDYVITQQTDPAALVLKLTPLRRRRRAASRHSGRTSKQ